MTKNKIDEKRDYLAPTIEVVKVVTDGGILTEFSTQLPGVSDGGSAFGQDGSTVSTEEPL